MAVLDDSPDCFIDCPSPQDNYILPIDSHNQGLIINPWYNALSQSMPTCQYQTEVPNERTLELAVSTVTWKNPPTIILQGAASGCNRHRNKITGAH
eukprot:scaffold10520_cov115-Skeletonema_dohrnii-CCMP3373.AAC.3